MFSYYLLYRTVINKFDLSDAFNDWMMPIQLSNINLPDLDLKAFIIVKTKTIVPVVVNIYFYDTQFHNKYSMPKSLGNITLIY